MIKDPLLQRIRENRQHGTKLVPYGYYECRMPEAFMTVPVHWHPEFEMNYVVSGTGEFILGDERYIVTAGDVLLLPPDMLHAVYTIPNTSLVYEAFVFNQSLLGTASNDRCSMDCIRPIATGSVKFSSLITDTNPQIEEFRNCAKQIMRCAQKNSPQHDLLLKSELLRFFWLLEQQPPEKELTTPEISYGMMMRPSLQFINEHFAENLSIEQLAKQLHISKSYYMFCFKKAVGIGTFEYLTQLRVTAACNELQNSNRSIAEIALQCGYNNLSNFNRQFRKIMNCTPREYRNDVQS